MERIPARRHADDVPARKPRATLHGERAERKRFYNSAAWKRCRALKLARSPLCESCLEQGRIEPATEVHHLKKLADHPELGLNLDNLMSSCKPCHSALTGKGF